MKPIVDIDLEGLDVAMLGAPPEKHYDNKKMYSWGYHSFEVLAKSWSWPADATKQGARKMGQLAVAEYL